MICDDFYFSPHLQVIIMISYWQQLMHLWINWIMHTPTHMRFIECFEVQDVIKQIDFGDFKTSVIYIYICM